MDPENGPNPAPSRRPLGLIVAVGVVVLAGLAFGAYLLLKPSDRNVANDAASKSTADVHATPVSNLNTLEMVPPELGKDFTAHPLGIAALKDYLITAGDNTCEFQFGTAKATDIPGTDLGDIVAKSLASYRQNGATVTGPDSAKALVLADAGSPSKTYSLPTLNVSFTDSKKATHITSHYSAAILKNGDRAIVLRVCGNKSGTINDKELGELDSLAAQIKIKTP